MPGAPETENKRIYQIYGPKSGRDRFGNSGSDRLRGSFWNSVGLRNKRIICKVVAYGRWSLTRNGRYERVDCNKAYRKIPKISPSLYCWFSVSRHSKKIKIKMKTIGQIKSRIWEMKGGKYTKTLAKIWVEGIIGIRDILGNVLPKFIQLCMETPCWSSSGWAPTWRTETNRNICYRVLLQKREFTPRGTHKH